MRTIVSTTLLAAWLALPTPARAGAPDPSPRPVTPAWTVGAEQEGAESVFNHAAGLGFLEGFEFAGGYTANLSGDGPGSGFSGVLGIPLGVLNLGFGLSRLSDGPELDTHTTRFDVGFAFGAGNVASLGFNWHGLYSDTFDQIDDYSTWSVSTTLRPFRAMSLALALDRFDQPKLGASSLHPVVRISLGIRPGTERVTIGGEFQRVTSDGGGLKAGGSLRAMIVPGLAIGGYGRFVSPGEGQLDAGRPEVVEWGAYLSLAEGRGAYSLDVSVDGRAPTGGDQGSGTNLSVWVKTTSYRRPSLTSPTNLVVEVPIAGPIPERPEGGLFSAGPTPFAYYLAALDVIAGDPDVSGVLVKMQAPPGWGQAWELRQALTRLKDRGKKVVFYVPTGLDMRGLYMASIADHLMMHPAGAAILPGLAITRTYLAGMLDKLGIKAEIVRLEEFKSAPERLTEEGPSDPSVQQTAEMLETYKRIWLESVAEGLGKEEADLEVIIGETPQVMTQAKDAGIVDELVYDDAVDDTLKRLFGGDVRRVRGYRPAPQSWRRWGGQRRIVIIPVVGNIVDGKSGSLPIPIIGGASSGDETLVPALNAAAASGDVVGIVLRVSSPGGSVMASEKIRRAVEQAARKKPLVISFGDVAASGGYYVSTVGERILATPLTVTGSIGIFNGKADLSGLYEKLGLTTHTQKTHERADAMSFARAWTDEERERAQAAIKAYYDVFVGYVATSRKMDKDKAYGVAKGRVWMGDKALENGLVDAHLGLWDAIGEIRAEAGVGSEPLTLDYLPKPGLFASLTRWFASAVGLIDNSELLIAEDALMKGLAAPVIRALRTLAGLQLTGEPMARMPFDVEVR